MYYLSTVNFLNGDVCDLDHIRKSHSLEVIKCGELMVSHATLFLSCACRLSRVYFFVSK